MRRTAPLLSALTTCTPPGPVWPTRTSLRWPSTLITAALGNSPTTCTTGSAQALVQAISNRPRQDSSRRRMVLLRRVEGIGLLPAGVQRAQLAALHQARHALVEQGGELATALGGGEADVERERGQEGDLVTL